jgi:hypothetical protein
MIANSNLNPDSNEINLIAAATGIAREELVAWANRPRAKETARVIPAR